MADVVSACGVGSVLTERYELVRHLARGGMGEVFEAEDQRLHRRVAIKVFRATSSGDRARFRSEALTLAGLNHPGLVQVYDAGEHAGEPFLVLELVEGPTLAERRAAEGPMTSREVTELVAPLADALAFVHANGVVHRDVTPSNVLCGADGRPRLADFGIARLVDSTRITAAATALGTAAYMAPEQLQGHEVTPAADVYALGLVALELLTGGPAFDGAGREVAMARLVRGPRIPAAVPGAWRSLIEDMTARSPGDRPSADAVRDRVDSIEHHASAVTSALPVTSTTASDDITEVGPAEPVTEVLALPLAEPGPRRWPRRAIAWATAAVVALAVVIGVAFAGGGGGSDVEVPPTSTTVQPAAEPPTSPTTTVTESDPGSGASSGPKDEGPGAGKPKGKDPKKP